ncbi:MAG: hypothetical protein IJM15_08710 [Erysipelotrichaceae bacterium]|nr:hypothetical protein [Erysipelotrichaceae bacterium]
MNNLNGMLEAYLDDYDHIVVDINKRFCNGESRMFHLVDENNELIELKAERKEEKKGFVRYHLKADCPFVMGREYQIMAVNARRCPLQYRFIVKTKRFDEEFYYDKNDLGSTAVNGKTTFKLWAPTASEVSLKLSEGYMPMTRGEKGVYEITVDKDLQGESYSYLVRVNGNYRLISDPYGRASLADDQGSVVENRTFGKVPLELSNDPTDAIIYEVSVRDMTEEGTFAAFETKIPYLSSLGITHVQLMPVNDFYSVEEINRSLYYNWGYDPLQYMVLEGSYSSSARKPLAVNEEFASLVQKMHANKLAVVLDVVFNHHYNAQESSFEGSVPYYYFRYCDEKLSEGTWCGSEYDTERLMTRKFFTDVLEYYVRQYDIDGFRFDLMGFIDIETMNHFADTLKAIKPGLLLYGEGWIMPAGTEASRLAQMDKSEKMPQIGFFNNVFRDTIGGAIYDSGAKGYGSGKLTMADDAIGCVNGARFTARSQSVNYTECHDNYMLYDKLRLSCIDDSVEKIKQKQRLITAIVLLSQGIPFVHGGQEFYLSHGGRDNTYNGPAEVNSLVGKDGDKSLIEYLKALCEIRKKYGINRVALSDLSCENQWGILVQRLKNCEGRNIMIIVNPSDEKHHLRFDGERTVLLDKDGLNGSLTKGGYTVQPISVAVLSEDLK